MFQNYLAILNLYSSPSLDTNALLQGEMLFLNLNYVAPHVMGFAKQIQEVRIQTPFFFLFSFFKYKLLFFSFPFPVLNGNTVWPSLHVTFNLLNIKHRTKKAVFQYWHWKWNESYLHFTCSFISPLRIGNRILLYQHYNSYLGILKPYFQMIMTFTKTYTLDGYFRSCFSLEVNCFEKFSEITLQGGKKMYFSHNKISMHLLNSDSVYVLMAIFYFSFTRVNSVICIDTQFLMLQRMIHFTNYSGTSQSMLCWIACEICHYRKEDIESG